MMEFNETQKMTQWWLWLLLAGVVGIWVWGITQQIILDHPFGNHPMSDTGLLISAIFPLAIVFFFRSLTLSTTINAQGVYLRYAPLMSTQITWADVREAEIIRYGFVGYGIKASPTYGTVYNAKGNTGLLLHKKNGEKILIGTQQPEHLAQAVGQFIPLHSVAG
ncbi:hypothetical protein H8B15_10125 [Hymenobacter sp. BT507]|uniref:Bacterial Pleckstrin homology domain-containing protein n=1 Tax=Hymenobacter citatus TaxID=2763506 RepID=A0ABR7MJL9_9BACT|nr:hypothetical protein [Hymenobacter citatus]MBC6611281.1 hypothetical protein [Hymenobacter citatus]